MVPGIHYYKEERVDCEEIIGFDVDRVTGVKTPTSFCKIHYNRDGGAYLIPYVPKYKEHMTEEDPLMIQIKVLIYAQGGLLGEILPDLRAVSVGFHQDTVNLFCYFHGEYRDDYWDEMSSMETETSCGYLDGKMGFACIRCDEPIPIPLRGEMFVFVRKESIPTFDKEKSFHPIQSLRSHSIPTSFSLPERRVHILLSIQYALLGVVGKNVRFVSLEWTDHTITVYCIFHGKILDQDLEAMKRVQQEMSQDFPRDIVNIEGIRCDYPKPCPHKGTDKVYERLEVDFEGFNKKIEFLLSMQKALLGHISSDLLAVSIECESFDFQRNESIYTMHFFFMEDPSEKEKEELTSLATFVLGGPLHLTRKVTWNSLDDLLQRPNLGEDYAFMRKEATPAFEAKKADFFNMRKAKFLIPYIRSHKHICNFPFPSRRDHVLLSLQHALLGVIDKNVRSVRLTWKENAITVYFLFHGAIRESDREAMAHVKREMSQDFPKDTITVEGIRCDYPERWSGKGEEVVYERKEVVDS